MAKEKKGVRLDKIAKILGATRVIKLKRQPNVFELMAIANARWLQ